MTVALEAPKTKQDALMKPTNPHLRREVVSLIEELRKDNPEYSQEQFASEIGFSGAYLSQWIHDKFAGDIVKFESRIQERIDQIRRLRGIKRQRFCHLPFAIYNFTKAYLAKIHRTENIAVLSGPAGLCKTVACCDYYRESPSTLLITVDVVNRSAAGIQRLLSQRMNVPCRDVTDALQESPRLVIVDQAHQLHTSGRDLLFAINDKTTSPIALVGNERIIQIIEGRNVEEMNANEQFRSRVALKPEYLPMYDAKGTAADVGKYWFSPNEVRQFITLHGIECGGEFFRLARASAEGPGHLRSLHFRLVHVRELIREGLNDLDAWEEAEAILYRMTDASTELEAAA